MSALRDSITANAPLALTLGGLMIGFLFGALAYRTNFCTMGAISDMATFGDWRRFRAWMLAAAVAIVGTQALSAAGVVPVETSMYLAPRVNWLGHIAGGLMFGVGMVLAGGCASKNLVRLGGGDLKALVTLLVLGIVAFMTIGGLLGPARAAIDEATGISLAGINAPTQGFGDVLDSAAIWVPGTGRLVAVLLAAGAIFAFCGASRDFLASRNHVLGGAGIGLLVVAGWALTGLGFDEMSERPLAPVSLTFVRPTGDTIEWLERATAYGAPGFGVGTVFGAILGSFAAALTMRRFRLTAFTDTGDMLRSLAGAALMGAGGVMALGCTIGQGITGLSTLAIGSFLAFGAIVAGALTGLKMLERTL